MPRSPDLPAPQQINDISETRALAAWQEDPEQVLRGAVLASAECQGTGAYGMLDYWSSDPDAFIRVIRTLPYPAGELICRYVILGLRQQDIADMLGIPQTKCSKRLIQAQRAFAAIAAWGGEAPNERICAAILKPLGWDYQLFRNAQDKQVPLYVPHLIAEYGETHNYESIAAKHRISRVDVRRHLRQLAKRLSASSERNARMLGAWLTLLVVRSKTHGTGYKV